MVSFVEKGKTDAIVNGTVIKDVEIETEVTVKNVKIENDASNESWRFGTLRLDIQGDGRR